MNTRVLKVVTVTLLCALGYIGWKYFTSSRQTLAASFVAHQLENCRLEVQAAEDGLSAPSGVLHQLQWCLAYYDSNTNVLRGYRLLPLLKADRDRTVAAAIGYLRKNSTNDYGDDPHRWIEKY